MVARIKQNASDGASVRELLFSKVTVYTRKARTSTPKARTSKGLPRQEYSLEVRLFPTYLAIPESYDSVNSCCLLTQQVKTQRVSTDRASVSDSWE